MTPGAVSQSPTGLDEREVAAWRPVVTGCYAVAMLGAFMFLASGFASLDALRKTLGSFGPSADRLAPFWGLAVLVALAITIGYALAGKRLNGLGDSGAIARHLIVVVLIGLFLAFPPVQWITFGRPAAGAGHDHAQTEATAACPAGEAKAAEGQQTLPLAGPTTATTSPAAETPPPTRRGLYALTMQEHEALASAPQRTQTLPLAARHGSEPDHSATEGADEHKHADDSSECVEPKDDGHSHAHSAVVDRKRAGPRPDNTPSPKDPEPMPGMDHGKKGQ